MTLIRRIVTAHSHGEQRQASSPVRIRPAATNDRHRERDDCAFKYKDNDEMANGLPYGYAQLV